MRLENSSESAKLEHTNALKKCSEDGDRALVESAEQFKTKLIVEYQKYETLNEKYKVREAKKKTLNFLLSTTTGWTITSRTWVGLT